MKKITVVGAGLAGCEAAFTIAESGFSVDLIEMKPSRMSPAHHSANFAELVCSNSLKASRIDSAAGLLKEEMRRLGSVCLKAADASSVAAGGALAVDRSIFSKIVTEKIKSHKNINVIEKTADKVPEGGITVIATGPLTDGELASDIERKCGAKSLSFFDAAAPIVLADSIDFNKAFYASRYDRGDNDYINCPLNREEYTAFYNELINAESAVLKDFDKPLNVYEGCMPVEILAKRGEDSIRFGPLKPVGLRDPRTGHRPWAAVQLRRENADATMFNMVGFQTNLKFGEQKRVFSMIPGLENAEFVRYGVMHRNSFINSPKILNRDLSLKSDQKVFFAGQITGVEGYMESAACGIIAGINAVRRAQEKEPLVLPRFSMIGALLNYICDETNANFQPMGANFGILPPLDTNIRDKRERYGALSQRSLRWFDENEYKGETK